MALISTKKQLEQVQTAIASLLSGVTSVSIDGVSYTKASLSLLQDREALLYYRLSKKNVSKRTRPDFT